MIADNAIRMATLSDLASLVRLDDQTNPSPWGEGLIAEALTQRQNWVWQDENAEIQAWLTASFLFDQSELEWIVVNREQRRRGLARRLLNDWLSYGHKASVTQYLLEVRQSNSAAIALYASLGFQQVGLRKGYYKTETGLEAALLMLKQVP